METLSEVRSHDGTQGVYKHRSEATGTDMVFSVFMPTYAPQQKLPVLWYLSGLTCTHANVTDKGEYRAACQQHGLAFVAPDTSPRGPNVPDDAEAAYDFGLGAGFYVDATRPPFSQHYQMRRYIEQELPALVADNFQIDLSRQGITGHSMGGHGALTLALRNPTTYRSVSAFAPIVSPTACEWGNKALSNYIGEDKKDWREYDACALIEDGARLPEILVEQGEADGFLESQLKTHLLESICAKTGQVLTVNRRRGYDHSYHFISSFMSNHVAWHAERLKR